MKIVSAEFVTSAAASRGFPPPFLPEVAFAGKSNVGKSSLINSLLGRRQLVKTSATPGKTQTINFFRINGQWQFVDLPGYGFAKVPQAVRVGWETLISAYLRERPVLRGVVLILDARHDPGPLDVRMKEWLDEAALPTLFVANKVDKLTRSQQAVRAQAIARTLGLPEPPLAFSARTGVGRTHLWKCLSHWLQAPARERSVS